MNLLLLPVPLWLLLAAVAITLIPLALPLWRMQRRLNKHAQSIAHMDDWADAVDEFMKRHERIHRQKFIKYAVDSQIVHNSSPVRH